MGLPFRSGACGFPTFAQTFLAKVHFSTFILELHFPILEFNFVKISRPICCRFFNVVV